MSSNKWKNGSVCSNIWVGLGTSGLKVQKESEIVQGPSQQKEPYERRIVSEGLRRFNNIPSERKEEAHKDRHYVCLRIDSNLSWGVNQEPWTCLRRATHEADVT